METGFPLVMLIGPLLAAVVALFTRRYRRVNNIIGLVSLALLALLLLLATPGTGVFADNTVALFGRELVLTPFVRALFLFLYPATGVLFLVTLIRPAERALIPAGLAMLSPLSAALMISPAGLGAVLIVVAAAVTIPVLHGGRFESAAAAWRYFLLTAVGLAPILLALSTPASGISTGGWLWPGIGLLIWLGVFPFHIWVTGLARHASLPAMSLVLGIAQFVVVAFLLSVLDSLPAIRSANEFQAAVRWSATLSALVAAFLMARSSSWRDLVTGLVVLDMGMMPLAALSPGPDGLLVALPALLGRYLSLMLITLAVMMSLPANEHARPARIRRFVRQALWLYGCLSLIGLPLTPGFPGRWAQLTAAGEDINALPVGVIILALAVGTYCLLRARSLQSVVDESKRSVVAGTQFEIIFMIILLGIAGLLGLFPDLATSLAARMLSLG